MGGLLQVASLGSYLCYPDVTVRLANASDAFTFSRLVRTHVSIQYPGTEDGYPDRLFDEFLNGSSSSVSNTVRRVVFRIEDSASNANLFLVASIRLDNSVKIGPVVCTDGRHYRRLLTSALTQLAVTFESEGRSHLYATIPGRNIETIEAARAAEWTILGSLRGLYRSDAEVLASRPLGGPMHITQPGDLDEGWFTVPKRGGSARFVFSEPSTASIFQMAVDRALEDVEPGRLLYALSSRRIPISASILSLNSAINLYWWLR